MTIDLDFVGPVALFAIFIVCGLYLLFRTNRVSGKYAQAQEERGRPLLAKYERGIANKLTIKFIGLMLVVFPAILIVAMIMHRLHG